MQYAVFRYDASYHNTSPWRLCNSASPTLMDALSECRGACLGHDAPSRMKPRQTSIPYVWKMLYLTVGLKWSYAETFAIIPMPPRSLPDDALGCGEAGEL